MKITGQILKENRERKGISISEVALATKINARTVQAMEEGDIENLPPKTFLRGFVRSYASYLELDVESLLATFYEEMGTTKPKVAITETSTPRRERPSPGEADDTLNPKASTGFKIGAVTGILLLVVLIVFFKNKMDSYQSETVIEGVPESIESLPTEALPTPPIEGSTPEAALTPTPTPSESTTAVLAPTPSATPTPTPLPTHTPTATPSPSPIPTAKATPTTTPAPAPTPKPSPTPGVSPTPSVSPTPGPSRPQEVILEALDSVEVEAQIDNEPPQKILLKSDQVQTFKAKRRVVLKLSDGGAVNLIVNGVERGVPGDLGKPKRVEIQ